VFFTTIQSKIFGLEENILCFPYEISIHFFVNFLDIFKHSIKMLKLSRIGKIRVINL
jgi:hypothetical protein